jgi:hypothetical protein
MDELDNIITEPVPAEDLDYAFFRRKGIEWLQKLAGGQWTDHNTHDPGITVLEQLCYALTDLSYRIGFSIPDLMTTGEGTGWSDHFKPAAMLSSGPVNLRDWRKLLIDTEGVRNAWIYPLDTTSEQYDSRVFYDPVEEALRMSIPTINRDSQKSMQPIDMLGLYRVAFIPEPDKNPESVRIALRDRLHARRNLCEDFHQIEALALQGVAIKGRIEIGEVSDPAALLAKIYFVVQHYLSPRIRFYTLPERLEMGDLLEDLFEGPALDHGFLDDEEMDAFQLRRSVRISDIIRLIMNLEGVRAVQSLAISLPASPILASTQEGEPWEIIIPENYAPVLIIPPSSTPQKPADVGVELWKHGLPVRTNWEISRRWLQIMNNKEIERTKTLRQEAPAPPTGVDRQVGLHQSIQRQFPEIYGVGEVGLPASASALRSAQVRQFKAYLAIFDQLLANAFAQLGGVGKLFSLETGASDKTYFSQSMRGETPNFEPLINWQSITKAEQTGNVPVFLSSRDSLEEKEAGYNANLQKLTEGKNTVEARQIQWERRNRLLNHLLARFAEQVNEHDAEIKEQLFDQKETLLNQYTYLSRERNQAFDYTHAYRRPDNMARLERRLRLLLAFPLDNRRFLSDLLEDYPGGFHLVEHILFRPGLGDQGQQSPVLQLPVSEDGSRPPLQDPFSLQLSFVFPGWLLRFDEKENPGFRTAVIKTLREETPAHLRIFVHWLDRQEMAAFEETYRDWIVHLKAR